MKKVCNWIMCHVLGMHEWGPVRTKVAFVILGSNGAAAWSQCRYCCALNLFKN